MASLWNGPRLCGLRVGCAREAKKPTRSGGLAARTEKRPSFSAHLSHTLKTRSRTAIGRNVDVFDTSVNCDEAMHGSTTNILTEREELRNEIVECIRITQVPNEMHPF